MNREMDTNITNDKEKLTPRQVAELRMREFGQKIQSLEKVAVKKTNEAPKWLYAIGILAIGAFACKFPQRVAERAYTTETQKPKVENTYTATATETTMPTQTASVTPTPAETPRPKEKESRPWYINSEGIDFSKPYMFVGPEFTTDVYGVSTAGIFKPQARLVETRDGFPDWVDTWYNKPNENPTAELVVDVASTNGHIGIRGHDGKYTFLGNKDGKMGMVTKYWPFETMRQAKIGDVKHIMNDGSEMVDYVVVWQSAKISEAEFNEMWGTPNDPNLPFRLDMNKVGEPEEIRNVAGGIEIVYCEDYDPIAQVWRSRQVKTLLPVKELIKISATQTPTATQGQTLAPTETAKPLIRLFDRYINERQTAIEGEKMTDRTQKMAGFVEQFTQQDSSKAIRQPIISYISKLPEYQDMIARLVDGDKVNSQLNQLDSRSWGYGADRLQHLIECFKWVDMVTLLRDSAHPFLLGGSVYGTDAGPADIIPKSLKNIKNGERVVVHLDKYHVIVGGKFNYDELVPGDIIIDPIGGKPRANKTFPGHTAEVIGRNTENGKVSVMITQANYGDDGRIRFDEFSSQNDFDAMFGDGTVVIEEH